MSRKKYLSTGQFAKLCATSKDTLFHYDRMGLLKPKYVSANGYRRYSPEQFFEFDLIWVLKEAGSSLEDIKGYLSKFDTQSFIATLEEKRLELLEQRKRLAVRLDSLEHILKMTRSALTDNYGQMTVVEEKDDELLVATAMELDKGQEMTWDASAEFYSDHFNHCEEVGLRNLLPVGSIVPLANLLDGTFTESHLFSPADRPLEGEGILVKKKGRYASVLHKGGYDRMWADLPGLLKTLKRRGLKLIGPAYIYALLSYLASDEEENDVHRIMFQVA